MYINIDTVKLDQVNTHIKRSNWKHDGIRLELAFLNQNQNMNQNENMNPNESLPDTGNKLEITWN